MGDLYARGSYPHLPLDMVWGESIMRTERSRQELSKKVNMTILKEALSAIAFVALLGVILAVWIVL